MLDLILPKFAQNADIGHLALLIVSIGFSAAWQATFRELSAANRRFDTFVRELARFNQRLERDDR
jgi:hypothetical protein